MALMDKLRGELVDIIEWLEDSRTLLAWRFPRYQNEIKNGAQLIVREGQMALVLAIRSENDSLFTIGLFSNKPLLGAVLLTFALQMATIYVPWLNPIFKTQPLPAWELGLCIALAALVFVAVELEKAWRRQRMRAGARPT